MKKIPLYIQVLYGTGVSYAIFDQIFAQWVLTYYLPPANFSFKAFLTPGLLALALVISRFVDMVADPLVGYWSDRVKTKWGRRIPFIFAGTIPLALSTIAFFYPPKTGGAATFLYLALIGSIFFIFYTIVGAPYNALIPELSKTREDRLNLSTWQAVFRLLYTAIAMILPGILIAKLGRGDDEAGLRLMVIILSAFAVVGLMVTSFTIKEKEYSGGKTSNVGLKESITTAFHNKKFIFYLLGLLCFFIGFNILRASMNYFVTDIMGKSSGAITTVSALLFGVAAACFVPVKKIAAKTGYKKVMLVSLSLLSFCALFLFLLGKVIPADAGYLIFALCGIPVSGAAFIFPPAMLSEITADISENTGKQIEGIFFGIQGFFLKLAFLVSIAILPLILVSGSGYSFIEVLTSVPDHPQKTGIYNTSIWAIMFFIASYIFYFIYPEKKPEDNKGKEQLYGK